jgi:hypothetical protein
MRIFYEMEECEADESKEENGMDIRKSCAGVVEMEVEGCDEEKSKERSPSTVFLSDKQAKNNDRSNPC